MIRGAARSKMKLKKSEDAEAAESAERRSKRKRHIVNIRILIIVWGIVLALVAAAFIVSQASADFAKSATFPLVNIVISFASFVATSFFSISIFNHNAVVRDMNIEIKKNNDDVNARAEAFRTLQFIASNYTIVDFVDYMLMYEESDRYVNKLKSTKDFTFYMREDDVKTDDILEHFEDYRCVTVKIPIAIVEGRTIGKIKLARFKFVKDEKDHRFVSCGGPTAALILFNEDDKRSEIVVNLIMKKSSEFYKPRAVNPFLKIKVNLTMQSLLGVAVSGWIELYFTNPLKLDKDGVNKYKINSSQFEVSGLPVLLHGINSG
ncbi:hypothetical protein FACS1894211_04480 [Clostridia bacterium]|nr:hypothetical protein FACS1894211_04480 [Clostridia bacterium]